MDRRTFLASGAAAVAAPIGLLVGEREATAEAQADAWLRGDAEWLHNRKATANEEDCSGPLPDAADEQHLWRSAKSVSFLSGREYDGPSSHLAQLLNRARRRIGRKPCEIDPSLMADSYQWAKWMASHRRMVHASELRGAAEIIAVNGEYTNAVSQWWSSRGGRARGFLRRRRPRIGGHYRIMSGSQYTKIGAGVVQVRGGTWYCCARYA